MKVNRLRFRPDKDLIDVMALLVLASHGSTSITSAILILRLHQFGGQTACNKFIHRLVKKKLLVISKETNSDRRKKTCSVTALGFELIAEFKSNFVPLSDLNAIESSKDVI
jgi:DNA-binding PadR family transcriptional regulator